MSDVLDRGPLVPLRVDDNTVIYVESLEGEEQISTARWDEFLKPIEPVVTSIREMLERVKPNTAKVEFGVQLALESGAITSCIVKGSSDANLKITLEWKNS